MLLVRVVSMLSKRVARFSAPAEVREDRAPYGIEDDDDEDEDEKGRSPPRPQ